MGADVKLRHQTLGLILTIVFSWQLIAINGQYSPDLMSVPERIPIGAVFPLGHNNLQTIFKQTIQWHNSNASQKFIVETASELVDSNDPTRVVRQLQCLHFNRGIYAFLAPHFGAFAHKSALSFSSTYRVPLVGSSSLFAHHERSHSSEYNDFHGINLEPNYWPAIISVLKWYQWTKLIYIYDSDYGIFELQELLRHSHKDDHKIQLTTIKRISNAGEGYKLLKSLDRENKNTMKYVIVNCKLHMTKALIAYHIQDTTMERTNFHYLLTNILLSEMWSKEVPTAFNAVNITSFALPTDKNELKKLVQMKRTFINDFKENDMPSVEEALALDATQVLLQAFNLIMQSQINITKALETESVISTANFTRKATIDPTCPTLKPFKFGEIIANHLKITSTPGITGNIEFHSSGSRKNYSIEVFEITNNGLFEKIALWSDLSGLTVLHTNRLRINDRSNRPKKNSMTYTITTILEEPFLMIKRSDKGLSSGNGNQSYEGFVKDFVEIIAKFIEDGLQFKFRIVNDSKYGAPDPNSAFGWNGMIGELIRHEADLAIAPLSITTSRYRVVDFTQPFMTTGISLMMKKPTVVTPDMFPFVRPMTKEVWASIVIAVFGVSIIFYIVSKLSYDRDIKDNINPNNNQSNNISLCSSLSYSVGVLLYQVSGVYPHSISSRIVSFVWWLFVFITITSYLANLTATSVTTKMKFTLFNVLGKYESLSDAFVYYDQMLAPITSVEDLSKQNVLEYGTLRHSSTQTFFQNSNIGVYHEMWQRMQSMNNVFVDSYREGINKVRESEGQYVFILEAPMNDYTNDQIPCNTFKIGKNFHSIDYGIAVPLGSPLKEELNLAILKMKETGDLARLQSKWWGERSQCKLYDMKELSNTNLTLNNIFVGLLVLCVGLIFAFLVSIVEHFCNRKVSYNTRQSNYTITKHEESFEEEEKSSKRRIIPKE